LYRCWLASTIGMRTQISSTRNSHNPAPLHQDTESRDIHTLAKKETNKNTPLERLSRFNLHIKPLTPISAMYLPQTPGSLPKPRFLENPDRFLPAQSSFIFIYNSSETWAFAASVTHTPSVFSFSFKPHAGFFESEKVPQVRTQGRICELRRPPSSSLGLLFVYDFMRGWLSG
jgi:hypothetical protein